MPAAETPEPQPRPTRPVTLTGLSMRDLLASCAAADAVSRPPRAPEPDRGHPDHDHPDHGHPDRDRPNHDHPAQSRPKAA